MIPLLSTLLGLISAAILFIWAITTSTDNVLMFYSPSSLLLVLGGTSAATIVSYNVRDFTKGLWAFFHTLTPEKDTNKHMRNEIERILKWQNEFRQHGVTGIRSVLSKSELKHPFLQYCFELMEIGHPAQELRYLISLRIEAEFNRKTLPAKVLHTMASFAPGFGMVGTIIGLIIMLDNMDGDIASLGKGLALALITTLYGVILAQLIFKPAAIHIFKKFEGEYARLQVICDGLIFIVEKQDRLLILDRLNAMISPSAYYQIPNSE